ncbi:MAG TPA: zinc ribbon domain-containing protein [Anaerolineae bacterium]|nr:zinc ribbon domain-containing protein [Anaerolineae bacterium]
MYCQHCGVKLPDGAGECDICGQAVAKRGWGTAVAVIVFAFIILMGGIVWSQPNPAGANAAPVTIASEEIAALQAQVNPVEGYQLPAVPGDLGPQLLAAGAIDYDRFVQLYERSGRPLNEAQLTILTEGSNEPLVINQENAHFLLNLFWAAGLANQNPILTDGAMVQYGAGDVGRFASTGGWTIGQRPATELYASQPLIPLTPEQQVLVESVAANVYRPCCNNPTSFPDCNHGMAMLGLLELMASQGATEDELYEAAKYINAFWFPQQALETAVFFQATQDLGYTAVDGRMAVGSEVFSATGFQKTHQWLVAGGQLPQAPEGGNSCGVS